MNSLVIKWPLINLSFNIIEKPARQENQQNAESKPSTSKESPQTESPPQEKAKSSKSSEHRHSSGSDSANTNSAEEFENKDRNSGNKSGCCLLEDMKFLEKTIHDLTAILDKHETAASKRSV